MIKIKLVNYSENEFENLLSKQKETLIVYDGFICLLSKEEYWKFLCIGESYRNQIFQSGKDYCVEIDEYWDEFINWIEERKNGRL